AALFLFGRLNPRLLFKWRQHRSRHAAHKARDCAGQDLAHHANLLLPATTLLCAALLARRLLAAAFSGRAFLAGRFLSRLLPAALFPRRRFLACLLCWHDSLFSFKMYESVVYPI